MSIVQRGFSLFAENPPELAKSHFVYRALHEQASGCKSHLLRTLLPVAPEAITQEDFNNYIDAVHQIRWIIHSQLRSYNEQAIAWILQARPDLERKPEKKKTKNELPLGLRSGGLET